MDLKTREEQGRDECYDFKKAPEELFNDCWFFANLLQRRNSNNKPVRSFHTEPPTPSSSSSSHQEVLTGKSYEETFASIKKLPGRDGDDGYSRHVLLKAPSMPCSSDMIRKDKNHLLTRGKSGLRRSKLSNKKRLPSNLVRAPSLPICLRDHEDFEEDEDIEFSMGRLITLASMNSSDSCLSPRTNAAAAAAAAKGATPTSRIMSDTSEDVTPQYSMIRQLEPQKCLNALNSEELEGFNELGIEFDKIKMCPDVACTSTTGHVREKNTNRLYYNSNEGKNSAPLVPPIWGGKKSSNDTKEQIKFWARAVASNVRQEC